MQPGRDRQLVTASLMLASYLPALEATAVAAAVPTAVGQMGGVAHYSWSLSGGAVHEQLKAAVSRIGANGRPRRR